jgi:hypothetical protein
VAFAYVFSDYLIVPVGQVFVLADLREVLATCRVDVPLDKLHALVRKCTVAAETSTPLCTVPADSHHPPLSMTELVRMYKREDLHLQLMDILRRCPRCVSPREMAKIVGIVRFALHHGATS